MESCLYRVIDTIGWRWGFVVLSYAWLAILTIFQGTLVRLCCDRLRPVERSLAANAVMGQIWRSIVVLNVVLAPKDVREWLFWMLWFSSSGLLAVLQTVGREHFEHVVDNPRFGVVHHLRTLSLHAVVLFLGVVLAQLGWGEFVYWGKGPIGQVLVTQSQAPPQTVLCDSFYDYSEDDLDGGYGGVGHGSGECSVGESDFGDSTMASTDPERGGTGFALLLLCDLATTGTEVLLSALKYVANLVELSTRQDADSAYTEEGVMEQITFFTRLGQAILSASRTMYMFKSCSHCAFGRKVLIRFYTLLTGAKAIQRIHRAAWRVVLAREMDVAFPDASEQELKNMPRDESCAICLKTMSKAVKRLGCGHFFHTGCLRQYLNNNSSLEPLCPICRTVIPWHPSVVGIKPSPNAHPRGRRGGDNEPAGGDVRIPNPSVTTANNTSTGTAAMANGSGGDNNPLAFAPAVHRPPTPDGFSRAARGADSAVRMVRQMLRFGLTGAGRGVAAPAAGATVRSGRTRHVGVSASTATTAPNADRRTGGAHGSFEGVAQQLLEIFPDMEWDAALRAARLANGSTERAVEFALSSDNSVQGVGTGPPGDDHDIGAPSPSPSPSPSTSPSTRRSGQRSVAASGGGGIDVAEGRRRWWS
eukprot:g16600.t1